MDSDGGKTTPWKIFLRNSKQYQSRVTYVLRRQLSISQYPTEKVWIIAESSIYVNDDDPEP